jgi:hypothetical protein
MASQISISECLDEDLPAAMATISNGFGHDAPFFDYYFPAHDTPAGQESGLKRLQYWKQHSPKSTFLKATAEDGKLIGFGVWTFMTVPVSDKLDEVEEDVAGTWPDKDDADHMRELWQLYVPCRNGAIKDSKGRGVYGVYKSLFQPSPCCEVLTARQSLKCWQFIAIIKSGVPAYS